MGDEEPVRCQAAQEGGRDKAPLGKGRCITPLRLAPNRLCFGGRLTLRRAPESRDVEHALEVGLLLEPCSLTSSELGVDQCELWADGLGLQAGTEASSGPRQSPAAQAPKPKCRLAPWR